MLIWSKGQILPIQISHNVLPLNCLNILGDVLQKIINTPAHRNFFITGVENKNLL